MVNYGPWAENSAIQTTLNSNTKRILKQKPIADRNVSRITEEDPDENRDTEMHVMASKGFGVQSPNLSDRYQQTIYGDRPSTKDLSKRD